MNKRRRYRAVLLGTVCLLVVGAGGLWLRSERRQEALNRQLIAALVKDEKERLEHSGPYEHREAIALVNAGADPNTPVEPLPKPSLRQFWNYFIHRSPLPGNHCQTAFLLACGATWSDPTGFSDLYMGSHEDFAPLVEVMLQHGAIIESEDEDHYTALLFAAGQNNLKTLDILLKHGIDVNGHRGGMPSPLFWAVCFSTVYSRVDGTPNKANAALKTVHRLLAYGADPTMCEPNGLTALQMAQQCPELVALLKKAEAKK